MAVLINNTARLLVGLNAQGHKTPRWIPGRNPLNENYWNQVRGSSVMKAWQSGKDPMITVDLTNEMPNPNKPPTEKELDAFSLDDIRKALNDPDVPVQWHPVLEAELAKREEERDTTPTVKEALPLIEAETDRERLLAWADNEKRKTVREAIDKRLAELEMETETDVS